MEKYTNELELVIEKWSRDTRILLLDSPMDYFTEVKKVSNELGSLI